jgi:predicted membrane-bound spermidine synthase
VSEFSHGEFVEGYRAGTLRVHVDRKGAAKFVSGRMLLPFILLPLFGLAVAVALAGHFAAGAAIFIFALLFRTFVRASSHGFVLVQALNRAKFYREAVAAGVIRLEEKD